MNRDRHRFQLCANKVLKACQDHSLLDSTTSRMRRARKSGQKPIRYQKQREAFRKAHHVCAVINKLLHVHNLNCLEVILIKI